MTIVKGSSPASASFQAASNPISNRSTGFSRRPLRRVVEELS